LRSFYLAGEEREGQIVLDTANQCLDLFGERYGPYPYPELIVARMGTMEEWSTPAWSV